MASPQIDDTHLQTLAAEGLTATAIAKRLDLPRSTVRDRLKKLDPASLPSPTEDMAPHNLALVCPAMDVGMMADLQELIAW
jgi:hypothetical protein